MDMEIFHLITIIPKQ